MLLLVRFIETSILSSYLGSNARKCIAKPRLQAPLAEIGRISIPCSAFFKISKLSFHSKSTNTHYTILPVSENTGYGYFVCSIAYFKSKGLYWTDERICLNAGISRM